MLPVCQSKSSLFFVFFQHTRVFSLHSLFISVIRDAKIAALEKTSQDAEKLIAEARSEKMKHMDEVHAAQKKLADLESR